MFRCRLAPTPSHCRCRIALGAQTFQQDAGRLIVRVLRHQFTAKGFGEDGGGEFVDAGAGCGVLRLHLVGQGEQGFDAADDFGLFLK